MREFFDLLFAEIESCAYTQPMTFTSGNWQIIVYNNFLTKLFYGTVSLLTIDGCRAYRYVAFTFPSEHLLEEYKFAVEAVSDHGWPCSLEKGHFNVAYYDTVYHIPYVQSDVIKLYSEDNFTLQIYKNNRLYTGEDTDSRDEFDMGVC